MVRKQKVAIALAVVLLLVGALARPTYRHLVAAGLLLRFQFPRAQPEGLARFGMHAVEESELRLPSTAGELRMRRYRPVNVTNAPPMVLLPGMHHRGIDEGRLVHFARTMASAGVDAWTPELEGLRNYRIGPSVIQTVGASAAAVAKHVGRRTVGMLGISFAGGLALLAAADPNQGKTIGSVVAIGAHDDLARVARYYAGETVRGPDGTEPSVAPHPYGGGVLIYAHAESFFAHADLVAAREILRLMLEERQREARARLGELSPPGRLQMLRVLDRTDDRSLAHTLLGVVRSHANEFAAVSPHGRLRSLNVPVFLIHGADDPIVPSTETYWLAQEVPSHALKAVVVSPVLRHAELRKRPTLREQWELVHVMAEILGAAGRLE